MRVTLQKDEVWYGPWSEYGIWMPIDKSADFTARCKPNRSGNQVQPLLLSNQGRFIWGEDGFNVFVKDEIITATLQQTPEEDDPSAPGRQPELYDGFETLRGAYLAASKKFFPASGKMPPELFFRGPQYNTWIELVYDQNQEDVLKYAHAIIDNGMPAGILMIDDNWSDYYGGWYFNKERFPEPKKMMDELHAMGFKVMLWICPFITPDRREYRYLRDHGMLVQETLPGGGRRPRMVEWWNGISAVLDFSNPAAADWLKAQTEKLMRDYGVDGFKFDAGDSHFYTEEDITYRPFTPNDQTEAWGKFGLNYAYNEYRACYKCAGQPLVQRLGDKHHAWEGNGLDTLIPNTLLQGLLGYSFTCPDMIGGGDAADLPNAAFPFDSELFLRSAAAATLLPMMQFSAAPWRVLRPEEMKIILKLLAVRETYIHVLMDLAKNAAMTGEPIVRYMEYVFPNQGFSHVTDQFMLGDDILVAPVVTKGARTREVILPEGRWKEAATGTVFDGGNTVAAEAPLDVVPIFCKM